MNTNSNTYTIVYASVIVIIVAFLLAFVSITLKPTQDKNIELDKKKQILASLNIRDLSTPKEVEDKYNEVIVLDMIITSEGDTVQLGKDKDKAGFLVGNKDINSNNLPIYICNIGGETKYVVPMFGRGLWGGLWGYMAINNDCSTVFGAYFSHQSETAGLGSPIAEQKFQDQFKGKHLFANDDFSNIALTIVKKGQVKVKENEVDGLTGATLTTKGAANMVNSGLQQYIHFLNANK